MPSDEQTAPSAAIHPPASSDWLPLTLNTSSAQSSATASHHDKRMGSFDAWQLFIPERELPLAREQHYVAKQCRTVTLRQRRRQWIHVSPHQTILQKQRAESWNSFPSECPENGKIIYPTTELYQAIIGARYYSRIHVQLPLAAWPLLADMLSF